MLTPKGLWSKLQGLGRRAVVDAIPVLERRSGELLLSIADFRASGLGTLVDVSRAVDDYCSSAKTAAETAVAIGSMLEEDLVLVRSSIETLQSAMAKARRDGAINDPSELFVEVDVDGMAIAVISRLRKGIGQMEAESDKDTERAVA